MIMRRVFLTSIFGLAITARTAFAQADPLAGSFAALSETQRRSAQDQMAMAGLYDGAVDGAFGPKTRASLVNTAVFIRDNSYGKVVFDLAKPAHASRFLNALSKGELGKYLWGEGDESAGG